MKQPTHTGNLIREAMERIGMNQTQLALDLGISSVAVSSYIYSDLPLYRALEVALALHLEASEIFDAMAKDYRNYLDHWAAERLQKAFTQASPAANEQPKKNLKKQKQKNLEF